jgi:hypothetical protein
VLPAPPLVAVPLRPAVAAPAPGAAPLPTDNDLRLARGLTGLGLASRGLGDGRGPEPFFAERGERNPLLRAWAVELCWPGAALLLGTPASTEGGNGTAAWLRRSSRCDEEGPNARSSAKEPPAKGPLDGGSGKPLDGGSGKEASMAAMVGWGEAGGDRA